MKFCTHCGEQINDDAYVCPKCGCKCEDMENKEVAKTKASNDSKSIMRLIAFILCLIDTIAMGFFLIPLIWCIPMTIAVWKSYKENTPCSTGLSICILIFLNMISGILLLVADNMND